MEINKLKDGGKDSEHSLPELQSSVDTGVPGNRQLIQGDGDGLKGKAERASAKELSCGRTKNVSAIFFSCQNVSGDTI